MKNSILAASILVVALAAAASAQVNPALSAVNPRVAKSVPSKTEPVPDVARATRARVLNQTQKSPTATTASADGQTFQAHAKANFKNRARLDSLQPEASLPDRNKRFKTVASGPNAPVNEPTATTNKNAAASTTTVIANAAPAAVASAASQIYRVGVGDVLDIQLQDNPGQASTLFTVLNGGLLEYPLAGSPLPVTGLTTSEIATALRQKIKLFENPAVVVNVRDYASHTVTISGFIAAPGTKTLRREAVPLYAILAESLVLPEAARVTITRASNTIAVDLKNSQLSATLVLPGDLIKVWP